LEYRKYKEILDEMRVMEETRSTKFQRGNVSSELRVIASKALVDVELESLTLYKLLTTFHKLMEEYEIRGSKTIHRIAKYNYTIEDQQIFIMSKLKKGKKVGFKSLFSGLENKIHAIVTFLSLLELLNIQKVLVTQGEGINNFWITSLETDS
jgi:segregation and condensation protein A